MCPGLPLRDPGPESSLISVVCCSQRSATLAASGLEHRCHPLASFRSPSAVLGILLFLLGCCCGFITDTALASDLELTLPDGKWSITRPLQQTEVLAISIPASKGWRRVELALVSGSVEIPLTAFEVDAGEASLLLSGAELFGPDPTRLLEGDLLVSVMEDGQETLRSTIAAVIDPTPWYPTGATPEDVLDRAGRKLREGLTTDAAMELESLRGHKMEPELSSEWMRLTASVQHAYSNVSPIHARTAEQFLEEAANRAPDQTAAQERVLIDQATQSIRNASYSSDREEWRTELTSALARARSALAQANARGDRGIAAAALVEIASAASYRGWVQETRTATAAALDLVGDPDTSWKCAVARARVLMISGKLDLARIEASDALATVERIRSQRGDDAAALSPRRDPALLLADIESRRGDALASLLAAEHIRVRSSGETAPERSDLEEVARRTEGLATVIVTLDAGEVLLVWTSRNGQWDLRRVDQNPGEATRRGLDLHRSRGTDPAAVKWLSKKILGSDFPASDRLLLAPIGGMRRIPWGILNIDGSTLVERCSWSLLPSVTAARRALGPLPREGWWTLVDPVVPHQPALQGSRVEGQRVVDRLPKAVLRAGAEVTRSAVIDATREARVLHIACHGEFLAYQPTSSRLLLTPENGSDGSFTAAELAKEDLSHCRMLALTGCETAIGSAAGADDLAGFPRAAFQAGCQAILGTLWPVEDSSAGRLVASVVEATDGLKGPAEVLREACSDRRADPRDRDPSAWSGWVLVENGW